MNQAHEYSIYVSVIVLNFVLLIGLIALVQGRFIRRTIPNSIAFVFGILIFATFIIGGLMGLFS